MKKSNSKQKAQGAFKKLGAVALITATIFFVTCNQTGGGGGKPTPPPTPKPKHAITFSVEGGNGTLKAKADGVDETSTSPLNVEEGKTVTFTATPAEGYRVKGWTLDGKPITEAGTNTEYKLKVTKAATVSVSFKLKKYAIIFSVEGGNGTLKAKTEGMATETEASLINVEESKTVTFTAKADDGYRVKGWTLDGSAVNGTAETYTLTVTQAAIVSVSFEPNPVEGGAVLILNPDKLNIKVKAKTEDGSAITVEGCNETTLTSDVETTLNATGTKVILKGNITEFRCEGTYANKQSLTALNVSGLTSLQVLNCEYSQLTELNVQGCTSLKVLKCHENKLTELNVQGLTSLQELYCSSSKLTALNVQGLTALKELRCYRNQLTSLNLQGCSALKKLLFYGNKLNAQAMTKLLNALPAREASDGAKAVLYSEDSLVTDRNHTDFTQPESLKKAFENAKNIKHWKLQKMRGYLDEDI